MTTPNREKNPLLSPTPTASHLSSSFPLPSTLSVKAVILVGGPSKGTRFRPLSLYCPKPLFPIAGQPLFFHHVHELSQLPPLQEIYLIGFFEENVFAPYLDSLHQLYPKLKIRYLREYQPLGTAGGLYHFRDELLKHQTQYLIVLHADMCVDISIPLLLQSHLLYQQTTSPEVLVTLFATQVSLETTHRYGCMIVKSNYTWQEHPHVFGGEVVHYVEKPDFQVSQTINAGMYVFDCAIFKYLEQTWKQASTTPLHSKLEFNLTASMESMLTLNPSSTKPLSDQLWFEHDVFKQLAGTKKLAALVDPDAVWLPIKNATSVVLANSLMLQVLEKNKLKGSMEGQKNDPCIVGPVYIHPTAEIHPTAKIGPNVSIGSRVVIHSGVRVRDSVILDGAVLHSNACILSSVVGWNSMVGQWTRVEGTPLSSISKKPYPEEEATLMRNGHKTATATVLGHDVTLANEIIVRNCIVLPHKTLGSSHQNDILM